MPEGKLHRGVILSATVVLCAASLSCVGHWGGLGYFAGMGRDTKVDQEFTLPENTLVILVDDPGEKVQWPRARGLLAEYVGEELAQHDAVEKIVRPEAVARLRRMDTEFESYPATVVGRKVGADTVLLLEVRDFFAPVEIEDTSTAAKMTVAVKVLNANERDNADDVRLWPVDRGGHIIETQLKAVEVHALEGDQATARELARRTAIHVARLFYQHTLGDIDDEP